jgi:hypothetical protein
MSDKPALLPDERIEQLADYATRAIHGDQYKIATRLEIEQVIRQAVKESRALPAGSVVVPREPTEEMRETWLNSWMGHHDHWTFGMSVTVAEGIVEEFGTAYRAMIAAGGDNG